MSKRPTFIFLAGIALLAWATPAAAVDNPHMVKNIRTNGDSNPINLTAVGGRLFFSALTGAHGRELWVSDGTGPGTFLVKNIRPGNASSNPEWLTNVNGTLYFAANDGTNGRELWISDGTGPGTHLVENINPGASADPQSLTALGNRLFFSADDGTSGRELWKSKGTTQNTKRVKDILPGPDPGIQEEQEFDVVGNTLFFGAYESAPLPNSHDVDLWKSDGTSSGTKRLKDLPNGGFGNGRLEEMTEAAGILYFIGGTNSGAVRLFRSNGTQAGTVQVPGDPKPNLLYGLTDVNGIAHFAAQDPIGNSQSGLWISDGTAPGTQFVTDPSGPSGANPQGLMAAADRLFFILETGGVGVELWTSDGTVPGTYLVKADSLYEFAAVGDFLYFAVAGTSELWRTDGTTTVLATSLPDPSWDLTVVGNDIFFVGHDGTNGNELWVYELV